MSNRHTVTDVDRGASTEALLLDTLRDRTGRGELRYEEAPTPLSGGFYAEMLRFRLADGRQARGPAVYDQPAYEIRQAEAGGYEVRRIQA